MIGSILITIIAIAVVVLAAFVAIFGAILVIIWVVKKTSRSD